MKKNRKALKEVCRIIDQKKGEGLQILDISKVSSFTDYFIICHGFNQRQNQAISDEIRERLKQDFNLTPSHVEGYSTAEWILMDYLSFVVHIFSPAARQFYKLERLWSDGVAVEPRALSA